MILPRGWYSMSKIMYSQKWVQLNQYPLDYYELLYQYYSSAGIRLPVTYYSLDLPNSAKDDEVLMGGTYELMGDLSGYLWRKILMLPVYNMEQINYTMLGDETGVGFRDTRTTLFIPTSYEFRPMIHDFLIYDQLSWRDDSFQLWQPLYEVTNLEKASTTNITFWRLTLQGSSRTKEEIESQLSGNYTFVDYEKRIYKTSDAIHLTKQRSKNSILPVNNFYNDRIGLYAETE